MFDLHIHTGNDTTSVAVQLNTMGGFGALLRSLVAGPGPQTVVLSDTRVDALFGSTLADSLRRAGFEPLSMQFEPGERSKSLRVAEEVYRFLSDHAIGRDAVIVALGGGVVSDLAGFVAATWMRGVRFAICPTTLEADVDAAIGGKTAINVPGGKNLVGAFHQPILVAVDPKCLRTLDPRDVRAGLAESVKHAVITSEEFLSWHEEHADAILSLEENRITELILRNLRIKAAIVEEDVHEQTDRRILLNFGHTVGHAIETCSDGALRHGECVSLGMVAACRLSEVLGHLDKSVTERVEKLLSRFGLPTQLSQPIAADRILQAIDRDKKVRHSSPRFVLLDGLGRPVVRTNIDADRVREAYESLLP